MVSRIIRRIVYAVLLGAFIFGVVRYEAAPDQKLMFDSLMTIETTIILLLAWCAVFLRVEPLLTRIALVVVTLLFWLTIAFRDSFVKHASSSRAATQCI
jgi:hypothetical protein